MIISFVVHIELTQFDVTIYGYFTSESKLCKFEPVILKYYLLCTELIEAQLSAELCPRTTMGWVKHMLQSLPYLAAPKHGSHQGSRPLIVELKVENPNFDIQVWTTKKLSKTSYMKNDPYYVKRILNPTILDVFFGIPNPQIPKIPFGILDWKWINSIWIAHKTSLGPISDHFGPF